MNTFLNKMKDFDYVKGGENVLIFMITVYAIVIGVLSYAWTAFLLWKEDHGEDVVTKMVQAAFNTFDFIAEI